VHLRNFGSNTKGGPEVVSKTPEPSPPVAQALVSARAGPVVRVQHVTVIPTNSSGTTQAPWGSITPTANRSNSTGFEATPLQEYQVDKNSVPAPTEACNPEYPTLVATDEIKVRIGDQNHLQVLTSPRTMTIVLLALMKMHKTLRERFIRLWLLGRLKRRHRRH